MVVYAILLRNARFASRPVSSVPWLRLRPVTRPTGRPKHKTARFMRTIDEEITDCCDRKRKPKMWESWPRGAWEDVRWILHVNDDESDPRYISAKDARRLLVSRYDLKVSERTMTRFAVEGLGRKSWKHAT